MMQPYLTLKDDTEKAYSEMKEDESVKEIYVPVSKFPKRVPEEGDYVSVTVNVY